MILHNFDSSDELEQALAEEAYYEHSERRITDNASLAVLECRNYQSCVNYEAVVNPGGKFHDNKGVNYWQLFESIAP